MDLAATGTGGFDFGGRQRQQRIALGVAVSLALHALLLSAWRSGVTLPVDNGPAPPETIAVWLRPPPPAPLPLERAAPLPAPERHPATPARRRRAPHVIAMPPAQQPPGRPPAEAQAQPQPVTGQAAPHFDPEAARRFARRIATERDPARADTAVGQFPDKPLETETKAARAISSSYRSYCKDGVPGGLLAPLYLLAKGKDHGCRW